MKNYQFIYDENKKLDEMFDELHGIHDIDIIEKNIIELLVEFGELANETRCFKYWSNKKSDKHEILEEYADCLIMALYFCNMVNLELPEYINDFREQDVIQQFKHLYFLGSQLTYELDEKLVKDIYLNTLHLGSLLSLSEEEIINACLEKIEKTKKRFDTGF